MIGLGNSSYFYNLEFDGISIKEHFKIYKNIGAIMNTGKNSDYESLFKIEDMNSLQHRRIELYH